MKKRGFYIGTSLLILLLFLSSGLYIVFGKAAIFLDKNGGLSAIAVAALCVCIFFSICDIALFMFTKQGKLTLKQSFAPQGTILVYLTATILITILVSYFSIFCVNKLETNTYDSHHESIVEMISSS